MQTRLILVRHGDSHHKEDGVIGGRQGCRGLNDLGLRQVTALAHRLADDLEAPPDAIYSSVLRRALETAEIMATAPW